MKRPDELFQLVHALSRTEKAYFKKFSSIYGNKEERTYLRLFDYLEKQKEYDDKKLLAHFKGEKFIRQPAVARHYLFNLILKSLESYHSSVDAELQSALHHIEILFEKGLFTSCDRLLARAKKTAHKYERYSYTLELLKWEIELARARSYVGKSEEEVEQLFAAIFHSLDECRNVHEYNFLVSRFFVKEVKGGFARTRSELKAYEPLLQGLKDEKHARSFRAKYYFLLSYIGYHSISNDHHRALEYSQKLVELLEVHPHQAEERPRIYVSALKNLISCLGKLKRYSEIAPVLEKIRNISVRTTALRNTIFYSAHTLELEVLIHTGEFEKAVRSLDDFEQQRKEKSVGPPNKLSETILNYNACCVHFGAGNFSAANAYLNRILNEPNIDLRSDIQCFARILALLIHYELGNEDLIPYLIRSTYRYLFKRKSLYRFEHIVIDFIRRKMPRTNSKKELLAAFAELKNDIMELSKDPFEQTALEYFDFISWLESKISGKSFAEVAREKVKAA